MKIYAVMTLVLSLCMLFLPFFALDTSKKQKQPSSAINVNTSNETVSVLAASSGNMEEIPLKEYIIGVVSAEMPASYEIEALKAQAVASYTYYKYLKENSADRSEFYITDSSTYSQAYLSEKQRQDLWQNKFESYNQKVTKAVEEVFGEYLSYDGKTALTLFHAISPGETCDCEEIFQKSLPYLKSVTAPGDKLSPDYITELSFSESEAKALINKKHPETKDNNLSFQTTDTDKNGYIISASVCGKDLSKKDLRDVFSLPSPFFEVKLENSSVIFTVYGKGHGVGMSQYSADYMARQSASYKDILAHFYKSTEISGK